LNPLILVVDDDPAVRAMLARGLSKHDYDVACAATADDAYALLADARVDVLLLDLWLQHLAGDALALAMVRQWPAMAGRIVLMSGDPGMLEQRQSGGPGFPILAKPFTLTQVLYLVDRILTRGSDQRRNGTDSRQP
jgi:DNA-binding response OmpR family regulator